MAPIPITSPESFFAGFFTRLGDGPALLDIIFAIIACLLLSFCLVVMGVLVYDYLRHIKRSARGVLVLAFRICPLTHIFAWAYERHQCRKLMERQATLTAEKLRREALTPDPGFYSGQAYMIEPARPQKAALTNICNKTAPRKIIRSNKHLPLKPLPSLDFDKESIHSIDTISQSISSASANERPLSVTSIGSAQAIKSINLDNMDQPIQGPYCDDFIFPFSPSDSFCSFHANDSEATYVPEDTDDWANGATGIYASHGIGMGNNCDSRNDSMKSTVKAVEDPAQTIQGPNGGSSNGCACGTTECANMIVSEYFDDSAESCDSSFVDYTPKYYILGTGEPMDYFIGQAVSE
ncbi:hypothetical protein CFIMG_005760RA [Ceratocystis fimbriata CBS 114723]|uniref:Uncharacterized protein n=1 Tax=Ceratocystis fimbriata CBS 114723 TaxID=1035309 RepID=A0A2C5X0A0_9PEZI|nr:hypothetical protein CFIMG_005760RA [Ceratocystis fimbriata CBS 114723]